MPKGQYAIEDAKPIGAYRIDEATVSAAHSGSTNAPKMPEASFGQRAVAAIGPAIRGVGDLGVPFTNLDINHGLEATGLVPQGRLTGPEGNPRAQATRTVSNLSSGAVLTGDLLSRVLKSMQVARAAKAAAELEKATAAARAAKTAKFAETGLIDASPEISAKAAEAAKSVLTKEAVQNAAKMLIKAGAFGAGAKYVSRYLD